MTYNFISIIVPVYNAGKCIERCVESIEKQTYREFEIILVDDGSKDNSGVVCDELAEKYSNIKVIHQQNSGASSARNAGTDIAQGKYIVYCDSDDCIDETMLEELINTKAKYPDRLPVCGIKKISGSKTVDCVIDDTPLLLIDKKDFFRIQEAQLFNGPVNKLYDAEIIREQAVRFNPGITMGEDMVFNSDYVLKSGCDFAVINKPLYIYYIEAEDSVSKRFIPDIFENYIAIDNKFKELIEFTEADMNIYGRRYATVTLFSIVNSIKNTMMPQNSASVVNKIRKIKEILNYFDIKSITSNADTSRYSSIYIKMLSAKCAAIIYLFRTVKK